MKAFSWICRITAFCPHGAPWTQCHECSVPEPDYAAFGRRVAEIMRDLMQNGYADLAWLIVQAAKDHGIPLDPPHAG